MTTVETSAPCCITGSRQAVVLATKDRNGKPLRTVISTASGLVFTDPRPATDQIETFYIHDYRQQYKQALTPKLKHVYRAGQRSLSRLQEFRHLLPARARILDAGSGGGELVYMCKQLGYDAHGVEPNVGYAEFSAKEYDIDVACGFIHNIKQQRESFDCVTLYHVLEHLENPVASLAELGSYLKPGGYLVVEVPNVDYTLTAPNQKWHIAHLYNFSPKTLAAVGARAGLTPVRVQSMGDGGVCLAIYRKPVGAYHPNIDEMLSGSFATTHRILTRHTYFSHYLRLHMPITRFFAKLAFTMREKKVVDQYSKSREILDDLVAKAA